VKPIDAITEAIKAMPVTFPGERVDCGYRLDVLVQSRAVVELKTVAKLEPVQVRAVDEYLELSGCEVGLLININVVRLTTGSVGLSEDTEHQARRPLLPRRTRRLIPLDANEPRRQIARETVEVPVRKTSKPSWRRTGDLLAEISLRSAIDH
jgi:hypothetical protein